MNILRHGKNVQTQRLTCWKCGCVFEFTKEECKTIDDTSNQDHLKFRWSIDCPECNNKYNVSFNQLGEYKGGE